MLRYSQFFNPHSTPLESRTQMVFEYLVIMFGNHSLQIGNSLHHLY